MKRALLLLAVSVFAGSTFAQANNHSPSSGPNTEGTTPARNERAPAGYRFHAQLYNSCCFYPGFTETTGAEAYGPGDESSQAGEIVYGHGEPDWQPSTFMKFSKAVSLGQRQQAALDQPSLPPSLGDIAREQRESESPDEKAQVVIKQKADGTAVIVPKEQ